MLYFSMLVLSTNKVVAERHLPAELWDVTVAKTKILAYKYRSDIDKFSKRGINPFSCTDCGKKHA